MDVIQVPAPPKEAFNKHRRISDLIKAQIAHLKHLEEKLPAGQRAGLPHHSIVTENDAARYIAAMTRLMRGDEAAAADRKRKRVLAIRSSAPIDLAAAAESQTDSARSAKKQPKKSAKATSAARGRR